MTALQAMAALEEADFTVLPGYVSKEGGWYMGDRRFLRPEFYRDLNQVIKAGKRFLLPADRGIELLTKSMLGFGGQMEQPEVVFPLFHGRFGEDGTVQGLLEMANRPYVGCGTLAGSVGADKFVAKRIAETVGLRVTEDVLIAKCEWQEQTEGVKARLKKVSLPAFVKPAGLGSSIGVARVETKDELINALEVAFCYDQRVVVERAIEEAGEVNISILGNGPYELSTTEMPVKSGGVLSFEDKYLRGGDKKTATKGMASASRVMPAPIDDKLIKEIETGARRVFGAIGGRGIARIDFLIDKKGQLYFNEINTLPGSLAFYLWEKSGLPFPKLVTKLVDLAVEDWQEKNKLVTIFKSNILANYSTSGAKEGG